MRIFKRLRSRVRRQNEKSNLRLCTFFFLSSPTSQTHTHHRYGFRHIQKIVRQLRTGRCKYDFVEIMACPGGCLNGGGQARPDDFKSVDAKSLLKKMETEFQASHPMSLYRDPEKSAFVAEIKRWSFIRAKASSSYEISRSTRDA